METAEEIKKYKQYLTNAQVNALVEKQRQYNNMHADERVEAEQSVRDQNDRTRRYLQNRGLASVQGNIISGEEPRRQAKVQTAFDTYNDQLQKAEAVPLEQEAIKAANRTIAARNAAYQSYLEEQKKQLEEQKKELRASGATKPLLQEKVDARQERYLQGTSASAGAGQRIAEKATQQLVSNTIRATLTPERRRTEEQNKTLELAKSYGLDTTPAQNATTTNAEKRLAGLAAAREKRLNTEEGQREEYYAATGYRETEAETKQLEKDLVQTKDSLEDLYIYRATLIENMNHDRHPETSGFREELAELDKKIESGQTRQSELEGKIKQGRDEMEKVNNSFEISYAFQQYGNLTDEEIDKELKELEAKTSVKNAANSIRNNLSNSANTGDAGTAWAANRAAGPASTVQSSEEDEKKRQRLQIVKAYRKLEQNEKTLEEGKTLAETGDTTAKHAYKAPENWDKSALGIWKLEDDMVEQYNLHSKRDTGSMYYKAVNDRDILLLFDADMKEEGERHGLYKLSEDFNGWYSGLTWKDEEEKATALSLQYSIYMTDAEVNAFNAVYNEKGPEAADAYFEALLPTLDQRGGDRVEEAAREFAKNLPVVSDILSVPINLLSGMVGPIVVWGRALQGSEMSKEEINRLNFAGLIRESRSEDWSEEGQFLYGTGMSMLDSAAAAGISKATGITWLGGAMLGGAAFNAALREGTERGLSQAQARITATAAGALEMLFETLSIDRLLRIGEAGTLKEIVINVLKQAGVEASEEVNTEIANMIADMVINGDKAKLMEEYRSMINRGYSQKEAYGQVAADAVKEIIVAGAGGFLSGGLMGAGATAIQYRGSNTQEMRSLGAQIRSNEIELNELLNYQFQNEDAAKLQKSKNLTDVELGRLQTQMEAEQQNGEIGKKLRGTDGAVEKLRGFSYDTAELQDLAKKQNLSDVELTTLYLAMQDQTNETIRQQLGVEGKNAVDAFEKITFGVDIDEKDAERIASSKTAVQVFNKTYGVSVATREDVMKAANTEAAKNRDVFGQPVSGSAISMAQGLRQAAQQPSRQSTRTEQPRETVTSRMTEEQRRLAALPSERDKTGTIKTDRGTVAYAFKTENARFLTSQHKAEFAFAQAIANTTGVNIRIVDTLEENGNYDRASNTLTVALDSSRGVMHTVSHELTHWLENTDLEAYKAFVSVLEEEINALDSYDLLPDDLQEWINENRKDGEPLFDTFVRYERQKDASLSEEGARAEAVAECCEPMLQNMDVQRRMASEHLSTARKIRNYLKGIYENIQKLLDRKDPSSREARLIESGAMDVKRVADAWANAVIEASRKQSRQNSEGKQYSIRENAKGKYVEFDREVIHGTDSSKWGKQVTDYINNEIRHGRDVTVYTEKGTALTITADTAGKAAFRNEIEVQGKQKRTMTDGEYALKLRAETHIDELAQISKGDGKTTLDKKNHLFVKEGFNYRVAYFRDKTGYYKMRISVGKNGKINTIYNVGRIEKAVFPTDGAQGPNRSKTETGNAAFDDSKPQNTGVVNRENSGTNQGEQHQRRDEVPLPVFDDQDEREQVKKPATAPEEIDSILQGKKYESALKRITKRKHEQMREWNKSHALADGRSFREKDVTALAKKLLDTVRQGEQAELYRDVKAGMKVSALADRLVDIAPRIWNTLTEGTDQQAVWADVQRLVSDMIGSVEGKDVSHAEELAELKREIPKTIWLNDAQYAEIVNVYKNIFTYMKLLQTALGDRGITVRRATAANPANLDQNWQSIVETVAREYVDISDADQPIALLNLADSMKVSTERVYADKAAAESAAEMLTGELFDGVIKLVPVRQDVSVEQAQQEVMKELADRATFFMKESENNRSDVNALQQERTGLKIQIKENERHIRSLDQQLQESVKKQAQAYKEGKSDAREAFVKRSLAESLKKNLAKLAAAANHPTTKKHIPQALMASVKEYMEKLSGYILDPKKSMDNQLLYNLAQAYERLKTEESGEFADIADEQVRSQIMALAAITSKKSFGELSADEMKIIKDTMAAVTHEITTANQLIGRSVREGVQEQGEKLIREMQNVKKSNFLSGYLYKSLSAERFARMATGYQEGAALVEEMQRLNDGAIEKERIAMEGNQLFADFISQYGKEYETWFGKKAKWIDVGIKDLEGNSVPITTGMKLSLIMHCRNTQNMLHILKGNIIVPDQKLYARGKTAEAYSGKNGHRVLFTTAEGAELEKTLTEAERAYLRCAEDLFYRYCPNAINKVSLQLYGYKKAEVKNYFPIRTDPNFTRTEFETISQNASIENMGMLKERVNAKNPIILEDITSAVRRQIDNTALFAGMAVPIRNFTRVYNVSTAFYGESAKGIVKEKLGEHGAEVIEGFLRDLQKRPHMDSDDRFMAKITSNIVRATLATNISVTIKQAASYPTAASVLSWKSLIKALGRGGKNGRVFSRADMELIDRYTPLLYIRRQGMIDRDIADYKASKNWADKMPAVMDWIRKVDVGTVGRLWYACEYDVKDLHPDLTVGSDTYYKEVAKLFNRVVQETQPNYTPLQRAQYLRKDNPLFHALFGMFKTQAIQNGGILVDAFGEFKATRNLAKDDSHRKAANVKFARAISSQVVQNVVFNAMTLLANAILQKMNPWRDKDEEITPESMALNFGVSMLSSLAGSFVFGSELFDMLMMGLNKATGRELVSVYDSSALLIDSVNDLKDVSGVVGEIVSGIKGEADAADVWKKAEKLIQPIAKIAGVPYANARNIIVGMVHHVEDLQTAIETGELDWFRHSSKSLSKAKIAALYKQWTSNGQGYGGKTFFYYKNQLDACKGTDEKKKTEVQRDLLMAADDLTPDQKAMLDEMLLYTGKAETRIENGVLQKLNDDEWETIADYSDRTMYDLSQKYSGKKYENILQIIERGVDVNTASAAREQYDGMSGDDKSQRFREWLMEQPYTAAEKRTLDECIIGNAAKVADYSNRDAFYLSGLTDAQKGRVSELRKQGIGDSIIAEAYQAYQKETKNGAGYNERFRDWLTSQRFTKEQKETLDMTITGVQKPQREY
ncbi:MAG: hypothetical protein IJP98_02290 [Clostridia bacterium]|nr:hypothetical protein [Clostridia bacterium]